MFDLLGLLTELCIQSLILSALILNLPCHFLKLFFLLLHVLVLFTLMIVAVRLLLVGSLGYLFIQLLVLLFFLPNVALQILYLFEVCIQLALELLNFLF